MRAPKLRIRIFGRLQPAVQPCSGFFFSRRPSPSQPHKPHHAHLKTAPAEPVECLGPARANAVAFRAPDLAAWPTSVLFGAALLRVGVSLAPLAVMGSAMGVRRRTASVNNASMAKLKGHAAILLLGMYLLPRLLQLFHLLHLHRQPLHLTRESRAQLKA